MGLTPLSSSAGLKENMLETLVPKVEGNRVMVVLGPQAGRVSSRPGHGVRGMRGCPGVWIGLADLTHHYSRWAAY